MFDRYVQGTKPSWKRRFLLTASLGLHAVAAVALIIYSFIHVEEITPPALSLTFFSAPPPPPPPPPPAAHKKTESHPHIEKKMVQPTTVQPIVQPKQEEKEEESDDEGEEGGVEGGVAGGVKGGVVGGVVGGTLGGTQGPPPKAKNVPPHYLDAQAIYKPDPHLPDIIRIQRKGTGESRFMAKVCVDQAGKVNQVSVIQGIPGADNDIVSTIRTWKYKPQPIPVCFMGQWLFTID
jgi:protein TonB